MERIFHSVSLTARKLLPECNHLTIAANTTTLLFPVANIAPETTSFTECYCASLYKTPAQTGASRGKCLSCSYDVDGRNQNPMLCPSSGNDFQCMRDSWTTNEPYFHSSNLSEEDDDSLRRPTSLGSLVTHQGIQQNQARPTAESFGRQFCYHDDSYGNHKINCYSSNVQAYSAEVEEDVTDEVYETQNFCSYQDSNGFTNVWLPNH